MVGPVMERTFVPDFGSCEDAASIDGCGVSKGFRLIAFLLAASDLPATGVSCFILS